jgi:DNA-binding transcriptional ArsR family regulator
MRKSRTLSTLFPKVRGDVLSATLLQSDKWWYLSELAEFLRTTPSSLQREVKALVDVGILEQRREGTRAYIKADTKSPFFPELRGLIEKTAGLLPTLQELLEPFGAKVECAFVYGSVARDEERSLSDVDLMVIGSVGARKPCAGAPESRRPPRPGSQCDDLLGERVSNQSEERSLPAGSLAFSKTIREGKPA